MDQRRLNETRGEGASTSVLSNGSGIFKGAALVASELRMKRSEFHGSFTCKPEFDMGKVHSSQWKELSRPMPVPEAKLLALNSRRFIRL